jgi:hypothetical protein
LNDYNRKQNTLQTHYLGLDCNNPQVRPITDVHASMNVWAEEDHEHHVTEFRFKENEKRYLIKEK